MKNVYRGHVYMVYETEETQSTALSVCDTKRWEDHSVESEVSCSTELSAILSKRLKYDKTNQAE